MKTLPHHYYQYLQSYLAASEFYNFLLLLVHSSDVNDNNEKKMKTLPHHYHQYLHSYLAASEFYHFLFFLLHSSDLNNN